MQSAKEAAANIAASAQSGLDKTKAVVQEKVDKMTAPNPIEKQLATERKEQKIQNAEITKQATYQQNAAMAHAAPHAPHVVGGPGPYSYSTTTTTGATTGGHQMSALPGHGTGQQPLVEGTAQSHPIWTATGTERPASMTGHNTHVGGPGPYPYSTTGATTGEHQMSALPGHGTGQQPLVEGTAQSHPIGTGQPLAEGTAQSHPIGTATGTERPAPLTGHNTPVGGGTGTGHGTGTGGYSG